MKFEIKNRWTGALIFSIETENFRLAVEAAVKNGSNLSGSNLSGSDLSGSNLSGSDLSHSKGINKNLGTYILHSPRTDKCVFGT